MSRYEPSSYVRFSEALGQSGGDRRQGARQHDDASADRDAAIQIDHVGVEHSDTAARNPVSNRFGQVGAVNTIDRATEINGAGAERVTLTSRHPAWKIRLALDHLLRRRPVGPLGHTGYGLRAGPSEAVPPDANAIADRRSVTEDVVEVGLSGIDDDRACRSVGAVVDDLASQIGVDGREG